MLPTSCSTANAQSVQQQQEQQGDRTSCPAAPAPASPRPAAPAPPQPALSAAALPARATRGSPGPTPRQTLQSPRQQLSASASGRCSASGALRRGSVLAAPEQPPAALPGPGPVLLSGSADGTIFVWHDRAGTGLVNEAQGQLLRHPLMHRGGRAGGLSDGSVLPEILLLVHRPANLQGVCRQAGGKQAATKVFLGS